jgi:SAM-dependent methyltransferase
MYDYWLGGWHNFAVDREAANRMAEAMPDVPAIAQANRAFLGRSIRWLVAHGVRQFLDIGSGIPTVGNVHEIAQRDGPESRVVYVDIDPVAVSHSQRFLAGNDRAAAIAADLRRPLEILAHPLLHRTLDLDRPVALLMLSMLHFLPDSDDPHRAVAELRDALAPGSYLVISHAVAEAIEPAAQARAREIYRTTATRGGAARSRPEIERFFGDYELVEPGLVWLPLWHPEYLDERFQGHPERSAFLAGIGQKP